MGLCFGSRIVSLLVLLMVFIIQVNCQKNIVFNIQDFGAIPNGYTDCSQALLRAWSTACELGSEDTATILIPSGKFLVRSLVFKGGCKCKAIVVEVDGVLLAPSEPLFGWKNWILFQDINGLVVRGNGSFDGQGSSAWSLSDCGRDPQCNSPPVGVGFESITNGLIQGITSLNSKYFHFSLNNCNNMNLNNLNINAPANSPNTDGIHVANSFNVQIYDTAISTGDDCISLGPGSTNVSISGIACGPGHGISIGSLGKYQGEKNVMGIIVRNCKISNTQNGLRIKTWAPSPPSRVSDVTFEGIILDNVNNPIIIDQQYCPHSDCIHQGASQVQISNINYIDIRGTSGTKIAVNLQCSRSVPCKDIKLNGIDIHYDVQNEVATSYCSNAIVTYQGQQIPNPCSPNFF